MPTIIGAGDPTSGYEIDNSLRFGGDNHHLSLVFSSAAADANRRTWTFSGWIKLGDVASQSTENYPNEKYLLQNKNPPEVKISFYENIKNLKSLTCYSNENDKWRQSVIKFENI